MGVGSAASVSEIERSVHAERGVAVCRRATATASVRRVCACVRRRQRAENSRRSDSCQPRAAQSSAEQRSAQRNSAAPRARRVTAAHFRAKQRPTRAAPPGCPWQWARSSSSRRPTAKQPPAASPSHTQPRARSTTQTARSRQPACREPWLTGHGAVWRALRTGPPAPLAPPRRGPKPHGCAAYCTPAQPSQEPVLAHAGVENSSPTALMPLLLARQNPNPRQKARKSRRVKGERREAPIAHRLRPIPHPFSNPSHFPVALPFSLPAPNLAPTPSIPSFLYFSVVAILRAALKHLSAASFLCFFASPASQQTSPAPTPDSTSSSCRLSSAQTRPAEHSRGPAIRANSWPRASSIKNSAQSRTAALRLRRRSQPSQAELAAPPTRPPYPLITPDFTYNGCPCSHFTERRHAASPRPSAAARTPAQWPCCRSSKDPTPGPGSSQ